MKLVDLLTDEALRLREFPVAREKVYFAHAAVCPLPARVAAAMQTYLGRAASSGQFDYLHRDAEAGGRALAAELLGVAADEIAFTSSTSAGLSQVAAGLEWQPGDRVLLAEGDFPGNVYPWLGLGRQGVQVDWIPAHFDRGVTLEDVQARLTDRTRLVSLSSVQYLTGAPVDTDGIGRHLRHRGVLFCVDAIQSFGGVPTSARHADFLVADGHKWLLAPQGVAVLCVRRENFRRLHPALLGWKSVAVPGNYHEVRLDLPDAARRYEPGSLNPVGLVGLHAALALLKEVGIPEIAAHLGELRGRLTAGLRGLGWDLLGPDRPELPTGITTFRRDGVPTAAVYKRLDRQGFVLSLRKDWQGRDCLRVSPHFYNTQEEVGRFLGALGPAAAATNQG
jgi:selenocysteine lyase/cysteine desulfurase